MLGKPKKPWYGTKTCEKGPKLGFEYLPTSKTSHCVRTACMAFPLHQYIRALHVELINRIAIQNVLDHRVGKKRSDGMAVVRHGPCLCWNVLLFSCLNVSMP